MRSATTRAVAISGPDRWISSSPGRRILVLLPLVLALDFVVVLALGLLPLDSIAGLECKAVLRGGGPKPDQTLTASIAARAELLCTDATSGRRLVMIGVGAFVLVLGAGAVLAPADRLEGALVRRQEDEDFERRWEEEARFEATREADARAARIQEERALGDARREAQERAAAERRAERVARARAARLKARAEAPAKKAGKGVKKVGKATKRPTKVTKKVAKSPTKVAKASKKVARPPRKVAAAPAAVPTVSTRPSKAAKAPGSKKVVTTAVQKAKIRRARTVRFTAPEPGPEEVPEVTQETPATDGPLTPPPGRQEYSDR